MKVSKRKRNKTHEVKRNRDLTIKQTKERNKKKGFKWKKKIQRKEVEQKKEMGQVEFTEKYNSFTDRTTYIQQLFQSSPATNNII